MPEYILSHATTHELAVAVEGNLHALFHAMMRLPDSEMVEGADVSYHLAFPTNPMFKGAWGTRLKQATADAAIEQVIAWYKERNAPFAFWWVTSFTEPADMAERLLAHGFNLWEAGDPGMAVVLDELNENITTPPNFRLVYATTEEQVRAWGETFVKIYEIPAWAGQAWQDATIALGVDKAPWKMVLGYLDDTPVATNMLYCGGGVASVYAVGTMPKARGQGIGAMITLKPLLDARAQGHKYGVLFSTELGHPVYERLGFRDTGVKVGRYLWRNS